MNFGWIFVAATAGVLLVGCKKSETASAPAVAATNSSPWEPTKAQPRLPTIKLFVGAAEISAEMALTPPQTATGMMFRTNIAENEGMLFVLPYPYRNGFWMKNCFVPLSLAYIDPRGVIREIHDLEPQNTNSVPPASGDIQFALETSRNWFARNNVQVGMKITTERGSLSKVFLRDQLP